MDDQDLAEAVAKSQALQKISSLDEIDDADFEHLLELREKIDGTRAKEHEDNEQECGLIFDSAKWAVYDGHGNEIKLSTRTSQKQAPEAYATYQNYVDREASKLLVETSAEEMITGEVKHINQSGGKMETANPIGSERTKTKAGQSEEVKESGVAKVKVIDEEKFAACVKATAPSSWTANWDEAARYVAKLANLKTPTLIASSTTLGEMFLQQVLYPPITALLYVFRPNLYCAGEMVACFETIMSKHGGLSCAALCELDGGIRLVEKFYAIAVMELKSFWNDALPNRGPYKCIVMTAMAAVYIHKARVENQEMDDPSMELAVPFIIGKHSLVNLYVMRMVGDRPIVQWIDSISFGSPGAETKKAQFIASLAVIVRDIVILCNKLDFSSHFFSSEITPIDLTALPNAIPSIQTGNPERKHPPEGDGDNPTKKTKADDVGGAGGQHDPAGEPAGTPTSVRGGGGNTPTGGRGGGGTHASNRNHEQRDPGSRERAACQVASRNGQVHHLTVPRRGPLRVDLDTDAVMMRRLQMEYFQQKSPFCFTGVFGETSHVFCKVWREGDQGADRVNVALEIELHRTANENGIPSASIVDSLTAMDQTIDDDVGGEMESQVYHVLVMMKHREDPVIHRDFATFALSLISAVQHLHSIQLLHCDIKPGNVIWDAQEKVVRLVDFGLAQWESGAMSYPTTDGYEAPEVENGAPHSRMSDTFSVGKTLEAFWVVAAGGSGHGLPDEIFDTIVRPLMSDSVTTRMSLSMAERALKDYMSRQSHSDA